MDSLHRWLRCACVLSLGGNAWEVETSAREKNRVQTFENGCSETVVHGPTACIVASGGACTLELAAANCAWLSSTGSWASCVCRHAALAGGFSLFTQR